MTKKELSQLYYLNREIKKDKEKLAELEAKAQRITQQAGKGGGTSGKSDKVGNYAVEIAEQKELINIKLRQCIILQNKIYRYINTIDDSFMRQIIQQRYIDNLSWVRIALNLGGNNTEDSVRMAHNRFLGK